jgi:hypothetical protein
MRQNIDEEWKTDPRRKELVKRLGRDRLADGMRVEINWLVLDYKGQPIPMKVFKFVEDFQVWIDCGLGELVDNGDAVRILGADRYKEFFEKQAANGQKGGRPKGSGKNPKKPKKTQTKPENPSSSFSSSGSNSNSGREGSAHARKPDTPPPPVDPPTQPDDPFGEGPFEVAAEIQAEPAIRFVASQVPPIRQREWLGRHGPSVFNESLTKAVVKKLAQMGTEDPRIHQDWLGYLENWFKKETRVAFVPKSGTPRPPAKAPPTPWPKHRNPKQVLNGMSPLEAFRAAGGR